MKNRVVRAKIGMVFIGVSMFYASFGMLELAYLAACAATVIMATLWDGKP